MKKADVKGRTMEFVALDFETANADMSSICQLGLVHFKDGLLQLAIL
jgi:DNA polymerase III epsilon subunit-like protein